MSYPSSPSVLRIFSVAPVALACRRALRRGAKSVAIGVGEVMTALASRA